MGTAAMAGNRTAKRACGSRDKVLCGYLKVHVGVGGHEELLAVDARDTNAPSLALAHLALVAVGLRGVEVVAADLDSRV